MAIDWIMRRTTEGRRQGIQWTLTSLLDDLDYADDIGLLASRNQDIQQKTQQLALSASTIGLGVNIGKTRVIKRTPEWATQSPSMASLCKMWTSSFTWAARSPQMETVQGRSTRESAKPTKPSQC